MFLSFAREPHDHVTAVQNQPQHFFMWGVRRESSSLGSTEICVSEALISWTDYWQDGQLVWMMVKRFDAAD